MSDISGINSGERFYPLRPVSVKNLAEEKKDELSSGNKGILKNGLQKEKTALSVCRRKEISAKEKAELKKACQEFESFFNYYLLKNMDKTVMRSENSLNGSRPMQFYREMLYERIADNTAEKGTGLSQSMNAQMQKFMINSTYK